MKKYSLILLSIIILSLITVPNPTSAFESRGNTSSAKWVSQIPGSPAGGSTVIYATPGGVLNFALTIKNTSKTDVFYSASDLQDEAYPFKGAHELRVGATSDVVYDNIFDFSYGGPFENNNRFIAFESGTPVFPGGQLTFYWNLKVKSNISNGSYRYAVGVVQEYDAWLGDNPGPGAGGPNNNLGGRSGGTIFWDIVIGGNNSNTATWSKLNNSSIGMSISYPWSYEAHGLGMFDQPTVSNEIQIYNTVTDDSISVGRLYDTTGWLDEFAGYSVSDWANEFWQFNNNKGYAINQLSATTLGGKTAYTFNIHNGIWFTPSGMGTALTSGVNYKVVLAYNNTGQKIVVFYSLDRADWEQIISTLQFI